MSGSQPITLIPPLLAAVAAVVVGFAAIWSNPHRPINRFFFSASIHVALWCACLYQAITDREHGLFSLRMTSAVGAMIILLIYRVIFGKRS